MKEKALHSFWNSFEIPAYEENSVPTSENDEYTPEFPYITYSVADGDFNAPVQLNATIWDRGESWLPVIQIKNDISEYIGRGGVFFKSDGETIYITRGIPFSQNRGDASDELIKGKYINITAEFISAD